MREIFADFKYDEVCGSFVLLNDNVPDCRVGYIEFNSRAVRRPF